MLRTGESNAKPERCVTSYAPYEGCESNAKPGRWEMNFPPHVSSGNPMVIWCVTSYAPYGDFNESV